MPDEILGELSVQISGDASELEKSIAEAQQAATQGASAIQDAFDKPDAFKPMADAFTSVGDAASGSVEGVRAFSDAATASSEGAQALESATQPLDAVLGDVGQSAGQAATGIEEVGSAAQHAAEGAHEAESGLAGMAEQLVAVGEALVITEGLKEFGQEALTAYGTVQSVTIGLTQLTGSAEKADEIVTSIKELAATEPFAFPEIAPTIQKMVALGVSAAQIPKVMQAVADAAAATGNQFSQVANSFDRMTLSGTVSARSLVQLGISVEQLGKAMGVAQGEVKDAFAALNQSQRIEALETALEKFAGAAEAQAQGIAGQWQIFKNTFEEVMVGVGEALTPAVSDILAFGKDVLIAVGSAVDAFNKLPEPVKEVAGVISLAVAAIAPLSIALGSFGLAVIGVKAAVGPLSALMAELGITSTAAAAGETLATGAAQRLAVADGEAAIAAEALATAEKDAALSSVGAAGGIAATGAAAVTAEEGVGALAVATGGAAAAMGPLGIAIGVVAAAFAGWGIYEAVKGSDDLSTSVTDLGTSVDKTANTISNEGVAGLNSYGKAATEAGKAFQGAKATLDIWGNSITDLGRQMAASSVEAMIAARGIVAAFVYGGQTSKTAVDVLGKALNDLATHSDSSSIILAKNAIAVAAGQTQVTQAVAAAIGKQNELNQAATNAGIVYNQAAAAMRNHTAAADGSLVTQSTLNRLWNDWQSAIKAANTELKQTPPVLTSLQNLMGDVTVKANTQIQAFKDAVTVYNQLKDGADQSVEGQIKLADALSRLETAAKAIGVELDTTKDKLQLNLEFPARDAKTPLDALVQTMNGVGPAAEAFTVILNDKTLPVFQAMPPMIRSAMDALTPFIGKLHDATTAAKDAASGIKSVGDSSAGATSSIIQTKGSAEQLNQGYTGLSNSADILAKVQDQVAQSTANASLTMVDQAQKAYDAATAINTLADAIRNEDSAQSSAKGGGKANNAAGMEELLALSADPFFGGGMQMADQLAAALGYVKIGMNMYETVAQWNAQMKTALDTQAATITAQGKYTATVQAGSDGLDHIVLTLNAASAAISTTTTAVTNLGSAATATVIPYQNVATAATGAATAVGAVTVAAGNLTGSLGSTETAIDAAGKAVAATIIPYGDVAAAAGKAASALSSASTSIGQSTSGYTSASDDLARALQNSAKDFQDAQNAVSSFTYTVQQAVSTVEGLASGASGDTGKGHYDSNGNWVTSYTVPAQPGGIFTGGPSGGTTDNSRTYTVPFVNAPNMGGPGNNGDYYQMGGSKNYLPPAGDSFSGYSGFQNSSLSPSEPGNKGGINLTLNFSTGTLVGSNGMQQLTDKVQNAVITALKQSGAKL